MVKEIIKTLSIVFILTALVFVGTELYWDRIQSSPETLVTEFYVNPYSGVLVVEMKQGQGSCFVVAHRNGYYYAITARHVVNQNMTMLSQPSSPITVDQEKYAAEIVRRDWEKDVALIRFKSPEKYKIYKITRAQIGERCETVGWSMGTFLRYRGFVVARDFRGFVTANGGVVPGCSGGPLLNKDFEVIGVTVQVAMYRYSIFDNTSFHVPSRFINAMVITIGD